MQLTKYKVCNFKSVRDSGWIECNDVTTLVGVNEAGKSNLLLALWKLNPVTGGEIDVLHDAPVSKLTDIRTTQETVPFVTASFEVSGGDMEAIIKELGFRITPIKNIEVTRYFDGHYDVTYQDKFPDIVIEEDEDSEPENDDISDEDESSEAILEQSTLDEIVIKLLPKFVYYSNYGNLSTRLYLPHVTKWLKGETVEGIVKNHEQIRTINVLFKSLFKNKCE